MAHLLELERHIAFKLSVRPFITLSDACHILWTVHARVLKFHIDMEKQLTHIFFLSELCPFLELCHFEKNLNEILSTRYLKKYLS